MKDFLEYMISGFRLTPESTFFSIVFTSTVNATLRFGALYGVIYLGVTAFRAALAR